MIPAQRSGPQAGLAATAAWLLATLFAATGLAAMWWLAPRVPYADGWRHLGRHLSEPFPWDVLAADNGHHELLPNLVRVLELRWFDAGQWLQVAVGMALAVATVAAAWPAIRRLVSPAARAAALLAVLIGIFWLGNFRALLHGNESVHAYAVTVLLVAGTWHIVRAGDPRDDVRSALAASLCGLLAAFSFGSGIACFAAFGTVLLLRRSYGAIGILSVGFVATVAALQLTGGTGESPAFAPLQQAELVLRWLAAPLVYAAWPLLDPEVAARIPMVAVRGPVGIVATAYEARFGPVMLARWPHVLASAAGLCWFAWAWRRAWRTRGRSQDGLACREAPTAALGLALSAFALATGALVAAMRLDYFTAAPEQLLAPRYVVWSTLFWVGLLLATVAHAARPRRACVAVVALALALLPSHGWMGLLGAGLRPAADAWAVAAAADVVVADHWPSENVADEVVATAPLARRAGTSVYAWPEARAMRRQVPAGHRPAQVGGVTVEVLPNGLGGDARRVAFNLAGQGCVRLLLVDPDGIVRGLAVRDASAASNAAWAGWMHGDAASAPGVLDCAATAALTGPSPG